MAMNPGGVVVGGDVEETDASEMLAAALEQMDGIIAGSKYEMYNGYSISGADGDCRPLVVDRVDELLRQLADILSDVSHRGDENVLRACLSHDVVDYVCRWLHNYDMDEDIRVLAEQYQSERDSLSKQTDILVEQIDTQALSITDLQTTITDYKEKLYTAQQIIEQVDFGNMRVVLLEKDSEIIDLRARVTDLHNILTLTQTPPLSLHQQDTNRSSPKSINRAIENENDRLKQALESLLATNKEKDRKIDDLRKSLNQYRKVHEMVISAQGRKVLESQLSGSIGSMEDYDIENTITSSVQCSEDIDNINISETQTDICDIVNSQITDSLNHSPTQPCVTESEICTHSPTPGADRITHPFVPGVVQTDKALTLTSSDSDTCTSPSNFLTKRSSSAEDVSSPRGGLLLTVADSSTGVGFPVMKSQSFKTNNNGRRNDREKRSSSEPNLADSDSSPVETAPILTLPGRGLQPYYDDENGDYQQSEQKNKKKGIKKIFGKIKRTGSGSIEDEDSPVEFKRGGFTRNTAGPRLGWSRELCTSQSDLDMPFARWDSDKICQWMSSLGLGSYVTLSRQWADRGEKLLRASPADLDKELGIRNCLHRKKLTLILQAIGSEEVDRFSELDYHWVIKWLDDIGLPQYKDTFSECRVDGRMLHYLTMEDLYLLKVSNVLHIASLRRAVQCLRLHNFNPNSLIRRPSENTATESVMLWTNHRVMEWLRCIDLSEYAPNLRGSGVHGALMLLEPRFNGETLAALLSIPPNKTLLRRHLCTHFVGLVGGGCQQQKREYQAKPGYIPLSAAGKVKPRKKFGRRRSREIDMEDFVCPMDMQIPSYVPLSSVDPYDGPCPKTKVTSIEIRGADRVHRQHDNHGNTGPEEHAVRQIGAFSQEINTLTRRLSDDDIFQGSYV